MKKNNGKFSKIFFSSLLFLVSFHDLEAQNVNTGTTASQAAAATAVDQNYQITSDKIDPSRFNNVAIIQGLNKITAKSSAIEIKIGDTIRFGKLTITALKCWQAPLEQKPESKILLEIFDSGSSNPDEDGKKNRIFYGWMFSSSPSISSIEHPIYDVTAIGCKNR